MNSKKKELAKKRKCDTINLPTKFDKFKIMFDEKKDMPDYIKNNSLWVVDMYKAVKKQKPTVSSSMAAGVVV